MAAHDRIRLIAQQNPASAGFCIVVSSPLMRTREISNSIARYALILLVGLTPFFVLPAAWAQVNESKLVLASTLIAAAMIAWIVARLSEGAIRIPRNFALAAVALLPIAYLISALLSHAPAESYVSGAGSQDTVVSMILLFALIALCALLFGKRVSVGGRMFLSAFFAGAGVVVLVQIVRLAFPSWLGLGGVLSGSASSVVGTWHDLGIFLALIVSLTLVLWSSLQFARGYARAGLVVLGVLSFALLFVIDMQDVWYMLAGSAFVLALYQWGSARFHERRRNTTALWRGAVSFFVSVLSLLCALSVIWIGTHLPQPLQIAQTDIRPSWQGTFAVGQKVFSGSGLIYGTGPNTFTEAWGQFKPVSVNQTQFWSVDFSAGVGVIPTSFVTAGLLGILAWTALFAALLVRTYHFVRRDRLSSIRALAAAFLFGAWFVLMFHVFYTPGLALTLLMAAFIGTFLALDAAEEPHEPLYVALHLRTPQRITIVAAVVAVSFSILIASTTAVRAAVSEMLVNKSALDYSQSSDIPHSLALVREALVVYPDNDTAHRAAVELGVLQMQQLLASGTQRDTKALQATLTQTIQDGLNAVSINSHDYQNWLALAGAYAQIGGAGVQGSYANALSAYQKAAHANPTNPLPPLGAAQVAIAENDASSSMAYLNAAIALKPDLAAAYFLRSQVETQQQSYIAAVNDAKAAVSLAQQDPLGWYNLGAILYTEGDYATSVQALTQAVSLENNYANALFLLSLALEKTGNYQQAIIEMQQVVALNPNDQSAAQALMSLEAQTNAPGAAAASTKVKRVPL